ncbi:hypothetical protein DFH06DRAFT_1335921 [Mycena polygramma]|nr:hypothetical protein DFH06DRAFT_1335921 [Mycena polygramma]
MSSPASPFTLSSSRARSTTAPNCAGRARPHIDDDNVIDPPNARVAAILRTCDSHCLRIRCSSETPAPPSSLPLPHVEADAVAGPRVLNRARTATTASESHNSIACPISGCVPIRKPRLHPVSLAIHRRSCQRKRKLRGGEYLCTGDERTQQLRHRPSTTLSTSLRATFHRQQHSARPQDSTTYAASLCAPSNTHHAPPGLRNAMDGAPSRACRRPPPCSSDSTRPARTTFRAHLVTLPIAERRPRQRRAHTALFPVPPTSALRFPNAQLPLSTRPGSPSSPATNATTTFTANARHKHTHAPPHILAHKGAAFIPHHLFRSPCLSLSAPSSAASSPPAPSRSLRHPDSGISPTRPCSPRPWSSSSLHPLLFRVARPRRYLTASSTQTCHSRSTRCCRVRRPTAPNSNSNCIREVGCKDVASRFA